MKASYALVRKPDGQVQPLCIRFDSERNCYVVTKHVSKHFLRRETGLKVATCIREMGLENNLESINQNVRRQICAVTGVPLKSVHKLTHAHKNPTSATSKHDFRIKQFFKMLGGECPDEWFAVSS